MKSSISAIKAFLRDEEGATAVEYGVMVALIAAAVVTIVFFVGQSVKNAFTQICVSLKNVTNVDCAAAAAG